MQQIFILEINNCTRTSDKAKEQIIGFVSETVYLKGLKWAERRFMYRDKH